MTRSEVPWKKLALSMRSMKYHGGAAAAIRGVINGRTCLEASKVDRQTGQSSQHHSAKWLYIHIHTYILLSQSAATTMFLAPALGSPSNNLATNARAQSNECTNQ